jgi:hypothetical protein
MFYSVVSVRSVADQSFCSHHEGTKFTKVYRLHVDLSLCVLCAFVVIIFDRIKVKSVFIPDKKSIDAAMVLEYGACKTILNKRWNHGRG